jgi:prevent-host-death family protein
MTEVSVKDARDNFRAWLDRAEAGEEIVITRRGKEVARLVPPRREPKRFPDLTEFRKSIELRGEPLSETVMRLRRESRY